MRRETRIKNRKDDLDMKIIKYSAIGLAILTIIVVALLIYSKELNKEVRDGTLTSEQISSILNQVNSQENTESASSEIGKNISEVEEEISKINEVEVEEKIENNVKDEVLTTKDINSVNTSTTLQNEKEEREENIKLDFEMPVEGDIIKDFAAENLVYSETLQEWTVHTGIDIKAEKMSVVKSAEAGIVKNIKNDPRYGLTVIVEHENGFETVYSNLLTSEFVVEGEKIEKGQSIGTVGNTAAFEVADEPHLHFEILKDSISVDPNIYIK